MLILIKGDSILDMEQHASSTDFYSKQHLFTKLYIFYVPIGPLVRLILLMWGHGFNHKNKNQNGYHLGAQMSSREVGFLAKKGKKEGASARSFLLQCLVVVTTPNLAQLLA